MVLEEVGPSPPVVGKHWVWGWPWIQSRQVRCTDLPLQQPEEDNIQ